MRQQMFTELEELGFSEYEARAYVSLLQRGPLTGYQLAKESGIPRPNIYPVLARLEQRGAVNKSDAKGAALYTALPAAQMLENAERAFATQLTRTREAMRGVQEAEVAAQVWNVDGYERVLERARGLIDSAREQLLLGVWSNESALLTESTRRAESRGVTVTTLCFQGCPDECGGCKGRVYRYELESAAGPRSLVVVRDRAELLVGQCQADGSARGAVTEMQAFVSITAQFLANTVAMAEIARSLGPGFTKLLDEDALYAVRHAGIRLDSTSWLDRLVRLSREN